MTKRVLCDQMKTISKNKDMCLVATQAPVISVLDKRVDNGSSGYSKTRRSQRAKRQHHQQQEESQSFTSTSGVESRKGRSAKKRVQTVQTSGLAGSCSSSSSLSSVNAQTKTDVVGPLSRECAQSVAAGSKDATRARKKRRVNDNKRSTNREQQQQQQQQQIAERCVSATEREPRGICSSVQALEALQQSSQPSSVTQSKTNNGARTSRSRSKKRSEKIPVDTSNLWGIHKFEPLEAVMSIDAGIMFTMHRVEQHIRADPDYLSKQSSLTAVMRATLFDWMFEVGQEFLLSRESLHTALNYVDRYLSVEPDVPKGDLQLVGVTALWAAAKNVEVHAPKVRDFAVSTNNAYTAEDIIRMEVNLLNKLQWIMDPVTCVGWADCYVQKLKMLLRKAFLADSFDDDDQVSHATTEAGSPDHSMESVVGTAIGSRKSRPPSLSVPMGVPEEIIDGLYTQVLEYVDVSLLDVKALKFLPSEIAASAFTFVFGSFFPNCSHLVERATRYTRDDLEDTLAWMRFAWELKTNFHAKLGHPRAHLVEYYHPRQDWKCLQRHNCGSLPLFKRYNKEQVRRDKAALAAQSQQSQDVAQGIQRPTAVRATAWTGNIDPTPNNARAKRPRWPKNDASSNSSCSCSATTRSHETLEIEGQEQSDQPVPNQEFDTLDLEANETL